MPSKQSLLKAAEAERHKRMAMEQEQIIKDATRRREHHLQNSSYTSPEEVIGIIGSIVIFLGLGAFVLSYF